MKNILYQPKELCRIENLKTTNCLMSRLFKDIEKEEITYKILQYLNRKEFVAIRNINLAGYQIFSNKYFRRNIIKERIMSVPMEIQILDTISMKNNISEYEKAIKIKFLFEFRYVHTIILRGIRISTVVWDVMTRNLKLLPELKTIHLGIYIYRKYS